MAHDEGARCMCVTEHRPTYDELHRHHVWPLGKGGPDVEENLLWLCPTQHVNVHELWRHWERYGGEPPWEIRRQYSHYCRSVVADGWQQMTEEAAI